MSKSSTSPEKIIDLAAHREGRRVVGALQVVIDDMNACLQSGEYSTEPTEFIAEAIGASQRFLSVALAYLKCTNTLTPEVISEIKDGFSKHFDQTLELVGHIEKAEWVSP